MTERIPEEIAMRVAQHFDKQTKTVRYFAWWPVRSSYTRKLLWLKRIERSFGEIMNPWGGYDHVYIDKGLDETPWEGTTFAGPDNAGKLWISRCGCHNAN